MKITIQDDEGKLTEIEVAGLLLVSQSVPNEQGQISQGALAMGQMNFFNAGRTIARLGEAHPQVTAEVAAGIIQGVMPTLLMAKMQERTMAEQKKRLVIATPGPNGTVIIPGQGE